MKPSPNPHSLIFLLLPLILHQSPVNSIHTNPPHSSIAFTTLGRATYAFDIFALPLTTPPTISNELKLTDSTSVNFNGQFILTSPIHILYVSERNGTSTIILDVVYYNDNQLSNPKPSNCKNQLQETRKRVLHEVHEVHGSVSKRVQVQLAGIDQSNGKISMKDRPTVVDDDLIYVSTHEDTGVARVSWAAVYLTKWRTGLTFRLTPEGVTDFSPAVSPSGLRTAVASLEQKGWNGEVDELSTDIYVFLTRDGSGRVKIVDHGGWPSWADESTLYFHRRCDDGWWSVFKAVLPEDGELGVDSVVTQRVTPPGVHAFTPAACLADKRYVVVATRRVSSEFRHIEIYDVVLNEFRELTRLVSPDTHHYNPFVSPDGTLVGYHKCRGVGNDVGSGSLILESLQNPLDDHVSMFRVGGSFPSFSPDGERLAYVGFPGLFVVNSDGSGMREILSETAFTTSWDFKRKGVVYTSIGPTFASESTKVDIVSVNVDDDDFGSYKKLTHGGENNAFPSPSPDGKWVVFRSGRSGYKNLYIMDAVNGEGDGGSLHRLTEGPWSDTMCNWSPDGDWIAFASDRDNPGAGSFAIYKIHPNGTGLEKVIHSGSGGRTNHPWFSPDSKYIVFTSDYAGVSAEPISNPHHYQPYGDIFVIRADGSGIQRLTHNSYEDGTPAWGPKFINPQDAGWPNGPLCDFEDCHWLNISPKLYNGGGDGGRGYVGSPSILQLQQKNIQCTH